MARQWHRHAAMTGKSVVAVRGTGMRRADRPEDLLRLDRLGTGALVIGSDGRMLWCIGPERFWLKRDGCEIVTYTAIGGKAEVGESLQSATLRELREESGCEASLLPALSTVVHDLDTGVWEYCEITGMPNPAVLYSSGRTGFSVAAYWARLEGTPKPSMEIPALL